MPLLILVPLSGQDWGFSRFADGNSGSTVVVFWWDVVPTRAHRFLSLASMVVGASWPPMGISLLAHGCKLMTGQIDWFGHSAGARRRVCV